MTYALRGYYQVLSDMQEMDFNNNTVQRVVRLMYEYDEVDSMGRIRFCTRLHPNAPNAKRKMYCKTVARDCIIS